MPGVLKVIEITDSVLLKSGLHFPTCKPTLDSWQPKCSDSTCQKVKKELYIKICITAALQFTITQIFLQNLIISYEKIPKENLALLILFC